ncbi:MAG: 16S rRNA (cytosine(967)-C(5))-methyltransferase RsmB, partial [Clostridia bacterium]|nr:16S rRNA (cytosine(967)-C(5))-methyltransferase RsmB [Clostridia bacterium]
ILRMALYQIAFMDKVPSSAAVNEAVKLCKKERLYQSSGFVNALLRNAAKSDLLTVLPSEKDQVKFLSVKYSCPEWLVKLWVKDYGKKVCEDILESLDGKPPVYIRVNTLTTNTAELTKKLVASGIEVKPVQGFANALEIKNFGSLGENVQYLQGMFYVQDLASQICCEILNAQPGDIVSDVCSAPGGKSFTAAVRMCGKGIVYSYDIYPHKIKLIEDTAERLGINNIKVSLRDALSDIPLNESDKIICDVPCSGLGVLRRKPEIRYKEDTGINSLPDIQLKILENTAKYLKSGGVLVYSTCTLNKEENSGVVNRFLSAHTDFEPCQIILPNGIKRTIDEPVHMLTLFPQTNNTDGFFICTIKKR